MRCKTLNFTKIKKCVLKRYCFKRNHFFYEKNANSQNRKKVPALYRLVKMPTFRGFCFFCVFWKPTFKSNYFDFFSQIKPSKGADLFFLDFWIYMKNLHENLHENLQLNCRKKKSTFLHAQTNCLKTHWFWSKSYNFVICLPLELDFWRISVLPVLM